MDPSVTQTIITGLAGCGGMLVGGFVVYHRVEGMLANLKAEIAAVKTETKDEFKEVWAKFDTVKPIRECDERQAGCLMQFQIFRASHEEIKTLFKELRQDMKDELRLLRECISEVTQGKCS